MGLAGAVDSPCAVTADAVAAIVSLNSTCAISAFLKRVRTHHDRIKMPSRTAQQSATTSSMSDMKKADGVGSGSL